MTSSDDEDDAKPAANTGIAKRRSDSETSTRTKKSRTSGHVKRPNDLPRRPLSAYNLFFRDQRAKILEERAERKQKAKAEGRELDEPGLFETLAKTIAERWKEIHPDDLKRYADDAKADSDRYQAEMKEYNRKMVVEHTQAARKRREESQQAEEIQSQQHAAAPASLRTSFVGRPFQQQQIHASTSSQVAHFQQTALGSDIRRGLDSLSPNLAISPTEVELQRQLLSRSMLLPFVTSVQSSNDSLLSGLPFRMVGLPSQGVSLVPTLYDRPRQAPGALDSLQWPLNAEHLLLGTDQQSELMARLLLQRDLMRPVPSLLESMFSRPEQQIDVLAALQIQQAQQNLTAQPAPLPFLQIQGPTSAASSLLELSNAVFGREASDRSGRDSFTSGPQVTGNVTNSIQLIHLLRQQQQVEELERTLRAEGEGRQEDNSQEYQGEE